MAVDYFIRPKQGKNPRELAKELEFINSDVDGISENDKEKYGLGEEYSLHIRMNIKHYSDVYAVLDAIKAIKGVDDVKMFYDKITDFGT
ncbi:MAG: hypothetical protein QXU82_00190 [Candidatus Aenigmatarchaeota archaeon]